MTTELNPVKFYLNKEAYDKLNALAAERKIGLGELIRQELSSSLGLSMTVPRRGTYQRGKSQNKNPRFSDGKSHEPYLLSEGYITRYISDAVSFLADAGVADQYSSLKSRIEVYKNWQRVAVPLLPGQPVPQEYVEAQLANADEFQLHREMLQLQAEMETLLDEKLADIADRIMLLDDTEFDQLSTVMKKLHAPPALAPAYQAEFERRLAMNHALADVPLPTDWTSEKIFLVLWTYEHSNQVSSDKFWNDEEINGLRCQRAGYSLVYGQRCADFLFNLKDERSPKNAVYHKVLDAGYEHTQAQLRVVWLCHDAPTEV